MSGSSLALVRDEAEAGRAWLRAHPERQGRPTLCSTDTAPEAKPHVHVAVVPEGLQRFSRMLAKELWITVESYADDDAFARRHVAAAVEVRSRLTTARDVERVSRACRRLNRAIERLNPSRPPWYQRVLRWRP